MESFTILHAWKVTNEVMYSYTRIDVHATHIHANQHIEKYVYIYIIIGTYI